MKIQTKITAFMLSVLMVFSLGFSAFAADTEDTTAKLSEELLQMIDKASDSDRLFVTVWFKEVELDIKSMVTSAMSKDGKELKEDILKAIELVFGGSGDYAESASVGAVKQVIAAKRDIAAGIYEDHNRKILIEALSSDKAATNISRYAPNADLLLTKDEIYLLAENEGVSYILPAFDGKFNEYTIKGDYGCKDTYFAMGGTLFDGDRFDYVNYYYADNKTLTTEPAEATPDIIGFNLKKGFQSWEFYGNQCGDYYFTSYMLTNDFADRNIYVPAEGKIYTLRDAYKKNVEGITDYLELCAGQSDGFIRRIGDVNRDGKLDIRDATYIQKCIAGIELFAQNDKIFCDSFPYELPTERSSEYISDYNRDGERNIKDATAIQKHIAGLE